METNSVKFVTYEQIEFSNEHQILFKFFVEQTGIGRKLATSISSQYPNKTNDELVDIIISALSNADPVDYLLELFNWPNDSISIGLDIATFGSCFIPSIFSFNEYDKMKLEPQRSKLNSFINYLQRVDIITK